MRSATAVTLARRARALHALRHRDAADDERAAEREPDRDGLVEEDRAEGHGERRDRVGVRHGARRAEALEPRVPEDVAEQRREHSEVEKERRLARARVDDGVDGRSAHERHETDRPDQARRGGQREQVVPPEQRLQDDVVERERERRAEHDERALGALERQVVARRRARPRSPLR